MTSSSATAAGAAALSEPAKRSLVGRLRVALSGALAAFLGLLPHVLHHVGFLAGAALFAGVGGTLLFGLIGLAAAIPFLLRMHRRCGNWSRPAAVLALMAAMFSVSAFVIGPAITGESDGDAGSASKPAPQTEQPSGQQDEQDPDHEVHH